jgi:uncharacterized GH25 family protein
MKSTHIIAATVGAVLAATACFAHDTWLLPRTPLAVDGKALLVDLTSGMAFPKLETGPKASRVAKGGWRTGTGSGSLDELDEASDALGLNVSPSGAGTAVVFVSLHPNKIEMDSDDVAAYFDEIGAPEALRRDWADEGADAKFQETYTKHAKTFVRMGDEESEDGDNTCLRPVGLTIEFVPQRDPTTLSVGDSLVVRAVGQVQELESFAVGIVCGATGESQLLRTNRMGFVAFPITDEGWWMVKGTQLRHKADGTFDSDFTTMTFYVDH